MIWLIRPFPSQKLLDRFRSIEQTVNGGGGCFDWIKHVGLNRKSSQDAIELVSRVPFVQSMFVDEGCPISDEEFRAFNLGCLRDLSIGPDTQLGVDAFRGIDFSRLQTLELAGRNIDDNCLAAIGPTPNLLSLSLVNTSVTVEGLRQFASVGRPLGHIELRQTPLEDDVFPVLAQFPNLSWIDLTGTNIDGSGLGHLRGNCRHLILSGTRLDWRHLANLIPSQAVTVTSNTGFNLAELTLRNTTFNPEALHVLKELSTRLWRLDVGAHRLPDEFFENKNLSLSQCAFEGLSVDPTNIQLYGGLHLALYFDARVTPPAKIVRQFDAIVDARFEDLKRTAQQMGWQTPTRRQANVSLIVDHLELTNQALTTLEAIEKEHHIELVNAVGPDRKVVFTNGVSHARGMYYSLSVPLDDD